MEPETLLFTLALLACPVSMGLMMWMMGRSRSGQRDQVASGDPAIADAATERLAALHARQQTLEAEIAEVTRLAELEAQRDTLRQEQEQRMGTAS